MSGRATLRRHRRLTSRLLALGACALVLGQAGARTVKIITADTLELRHIGDQELVIISGKEVELRLDNDVIRATRVEFNRTRRTLTMVGAATYHTAKDDQDLTGNDLVVDLGSEAVTGQDVLISDANLEIRGQEIERVPGQLQARGGYFTPCAKCGRTPNDYAFRAEQLVIYPGDRLIAYRAQLLLVDYPVLYLPIVVIPLNDKARQPRFDVGKKDPDGFTVEADLPFSIGSNILGTTLLRYYEKRSPQYGGGVDMRAYAPARWIDRADLYYLMLPRPFGADGKLREGTDSDLNFSVKGRIPLEYALRDLDYSLLVNRRDIGRSDTDKERGVTNVTFSAKADYPRFTTELNYLNRLGPEPTLAIQAPFKKTEVVLDPKPFSVGGLNADFKVTAGTYTAASNPRSRRASAEGLNFTTSRLEEAHVLNYTAKPWKDAEVQLSNNFVGRYYGNGARTVQFTVAGQFTQRWAGSNSLSVRQEYIRYEGTSPFAFDAVPGRRLSAPLTVSLNTVPAPGMTFGVKYTRDHFIQEFATERNERLSLSVGVNRKPVTANYSFDYNFAKGELDTLNYSVTLGDPESRKLTLVPARPAVAATPTTPAQPERPAYYKRSSAWPVPNLTLSTSGGYSRAAGGVQPITVRATVNGDVRTNSFSVYGTYDLNPPANFQDRPLISVGAEYSLVSPVDTVLNPVTLSGREELGVRYQRLSGNHTLTWRKLTFSTSHNLNLEPVPGAKSSGTVTFSVGNQRGAANSWEVSYGGPFDWQRGGFSTPQLTGKLSFTEPGQRLSAVASVNMPGLDQKRTELAQAALEGNWQKGRFSVSGRASYSRTRTGLYPDDKATDTLSFEPLRLGVALGSGPKPGAYLTASLRQTFRYVEGVRQNPQETIAPVIGLTIDRCCWAIQTEIDLKAQRYRLSIGLPGQYNTLFEADPKGYTVPLLPIQPWK